jgi:hypothetical protein
LWAIYLNDLPESLINSLFISYVDDVALLTHDNNFQEAERKMQTELNQIQKWAQENGMIINTIKTKVMTFIPPGNRTKPTPALTICNEPVENVNTFTYLGLLVDSKLSFNEHVNTVCTQMTSRTFLLNRYKRLFDFKWRHIFCTSLVISLSDYCLIVWGNISQTNSDRFDKIKFRAGCLYVLQKKLPFSHFHNVLEQLNWLTVGERYELFSLRFMYRNICNTSTLSKSFSHFFVKSKNLSLRSANNFSNPGITLSIGQASFSYQFFNAWNHLPTTLKETTCYNKFDYELRQLLINHRLNNHLAIKTRIVCQKIKL